MNFYNLLRKDRFCKKCGKEFDDCPACVGRGKITESVDLGTKSCPFYSVIEPNRGHLYHSVDSTYCSLCGSILSSDVKLVENICWTCFGSGTAPHKCSSKVKTLRVEHEGRLRISIT